MMAPLLGILLAMGIGAACRWADVPLPAPPKLTGALLVVAITFGFTATDWILKAS